MKMLFLQLLGSNILCALQAVFRFTLNIYQIAVAYKENKKGQSSAVHPFSTKFHLIFFTLIFTPINFR